MNVTNLDECLIPVKIVRLTAAYRNLLIKDGLQAVGVFPLPCKVRMELKTLLKGEGQGTQSGKGDKRFTIPTATTLQWPMNGIFIRGPQGEAPAEYGGTA